MKYLAITAILCLILAGASFAGNVTVTEVITGGDLTLTMPSNFTLGGTYTMLGGAASFTPTSIFIYYCVEDARGTGAGWNLGVQINQFATGGTPARTIPVANFEMQAATLFITELWGQTKDSTYGPKSLINSYTNVQSGETKILTAAANYGMGKYESWVNHRLTIDASAYAGTYTATLTATLNNVP